MKKPYLEITYRNGKPFAAYVYLPRLPGDTSARTVEAGRGILVDYAADGRPIGVEITAPQKVDREELMRVLRGASAAEFDLDRELSPLLAA